jgi:hypothetical protein
MSTSTKVDCHPGNIGRRIEMSAIGNGPSVTGIFAPFAEYYGNNKRGIGSHSNLHSSIRLVSSIKIARISAIEEKPTFDVILICIITAALKYLELTYQSLFERGISGYVKNKPSKFNINI